MKNNSSNSGDGGGDLVDRTAATLLLRHPALEPPWGVCRSPDGDLIMTGPPSVAELAASDVPDEPEIIRLFREVVGRRDELVVGLRHALALRRQVEIELPGDEDIHAVFDADAKACRDALERFDVSPTKWSLYAVPSDGSAFHASALHTLIKEHRNLGRPAALAAVRRWFCVALRATREPALEGAARGARHGADMHLGWYLGHPVDAAKLECLARASREIERGDGKAGGWDRIFSRMLEIDAGEFDVAHERRAELRERAARKYEALTGGTLHVGRDWDTDSAQI